MEKSTGIAIAVAASWDRKRVAVFAFFSALTFFFFCAGLANATVVGTQGLVYSIKEKDMRELIAEKARNFNFSEWKFKEAQRISETVSKFRPADASADLPTSVNGQAYNVDLTYTLPYNIYDLNGNIIYPAGFSYNPLELMRKKGMSLDKIIVVVNATRPNEITWFKEKFEDYKAPHILLLITDGYALEVAEKLGRKVQYLPEALKERFKIKETPSLVAQLPQTTHLTVKPYVIDHRGKELKVVNRKPQRSKGR